MTPKQLMIGGKKSYDDFGLLIASRNISQPKKKSIKESVPFSNTIYDFSKINGEIYWEERTLEYTFDIAEITTEEMEKIKSKALDWFMNVHDDDIYDPYIGDYHFHGSFDSDSWNEDFGAGELSISFTVYPYKISNSDVNVIEEIGVSDNGKIEYNNPTINVLRIYGDSVQNGAPTPSEPIEIQSVEFNEINITGKNLFEINNSSTNNGITITNNGDGTVTLNGTATMNTDLWVANGTSSKYKNIPIMKGVSVTQGVNEISGSYTGDVTLRTLVNDGVTTYWGNIEKNKTYTPDINITLRATEVLIQKGTTFNDWTIFPQLEIGKIATTPEQFHGETITLDDSISLHSLPDGTCDVYKNGVVTRKVGVFTFDGTQEPTSIIVNSTTGNTTFIFNDNVVPSIDKIGLSNMYCNQLEVSTHFGYRNFENQIIKWNDTSASFCMGIDTSLVGETKESIMSYFQNNPLIVYYPLKEEVIETFDLPTISTYSPITNVSFDSNLSSTFEVYYNDSKNITINNNSSHRITPTITSTGSFTIKLNNVSYSIGEGTYTSGLYLETGENKLTITGYGKITFSYSEEVF